MLELLIPQIPTKGKKDFIDGKGHFNFETAGDAWKLLVDGNQRFPKTADAVADVSVTLDPLTKAYEFGRTGGLKVGIQGGASFSHQVHILWPDRDATTAQEYGLTIPSDNLYARIVMTAQADGAANASFPIGTLSATLGIGAGGHVKYERWMLKPDTTGARDVLTQLYSGLRLPQSIDQADDLPLDGELLVLGYGGYLKLNAGLRWGYEITGSKSLDVPKMELDLDYQLRAMAAVDVGYQLAGDYQIEVRKARDGWVRFAVRKSRASETTLAADFGLTAQYTLKGLPESADEFLSKVFGVHADRILQLFHQGQKYSDLAELEQAAGKLLKETVHKYSNQVLGIVLSNTTVQDVIQKMNQVAGAYANLDKRIIDLYHDVLKEKEKLPAGAVSGIEIAINTVLGKSSPEDFAGLSGSQEFAPAVDLLRRLYNQKLFDVLQKNEGFAEAVKLLKHAKAFLEGTSAADAQIKQWIDMLQSQVPFDALLKQLAGLDANRLQALADEKLQGLVEKLLGKAWEALNKSDFAKLADLVHKDFVKIDEFKNKWYRAAVEKAAHQSFEMNLHLAYSRARRNEKLLEVEINLAHPDSKGPERARAAAAGDYQELLKNYDATAVRVIKGVVGSTLTDSLAVKFNVLGFGSEGLVTLFQNAEHAIESQDGGLLHVYTSNTYVERNRKSGRKFKEEVNSKFLVQAIGESFQAAGTSLRPYAMDILRSMTARYNLFQSDEDTTVAELTEYLRLAGALGLLDQDTRQYVEELASACGGSLGKVQLTYRVAFDAVTLRSAFHLSGTAGDPDGGKLGGLARQAMREFLLLKFASQPATNWLPRVVFAYAASQAYVWHRQAALLSKLKAVTVPAWYTGKQAEEQALSSESVSLVERLFNFEDEMVRGLLAVDAQVDSLSAGHTVDFRKLNDAVLQMVKAAGDVGQYDVSCFPVILDRLIQFSTEGQARRDSTVLLEVTPSKGTMAGKKITRILAGGPKNPAEIAVDDTPAAAPVAMGVAGSN